MTSVEFVYLDCDYDEILPDLIKLQFTIISTSLCFFNWNSFPGPRTPHRLDIANVSAYQADLHGLGSSALPKSVLEFTRHVLSVSHAASSSCSLPLSLRSPSNVTAGLGVRVSTAGALFLLLVE